MLSKTSTRDRCPLLLTTSYKCLLYQGLCDPFTTLNAGVLDLLAARDMLRRGVLGRKLAGMLSLSPVGVVNLCQSTPFRSDISGTSDPIAGGGAATMLLPMNNSHASFFGRRKSKAEGEGIAATPIISAAFVDRVERVERTELVCPSELCEELRAMLVRYGREATEASVRGEAAASGTVTGWSTSWPTSVTAYASVNGSGPIPIDRKSVV